MYNPCARPRVGGTVEVPQTPGIAPRTMVIVVGGIAGLVFYKKNRAIGGLAGAAIGTALLHVFDRLWWAA